MLETIGAVIGAGQGLANTASSIMGMLGGNEAAAAQRQANNIALLSWLENRRNAEQQRELAVAGRTDSRGNTVRYVPGQGWVTELSGTSRAIQGASDTEQLNRLTMDAMRARSRRQDNAQRQRREGDYANRMLPQLENAPTDRRVVEALLTEALVADANSGAENARNAVGINRIRSGTGGETALAMLNRGQMADTRSAIARARLQAGPETASRERNRLSGILDPYGMLASRASAPDDVPFQPAGIGEALDAGMLQQAVNAPQGMRGLSQIEAPRMGFAENRTPVGIASMGAALGQLPKQLGGLFGSGGSSTERTPEYGWGSGQYMPF